LAAYKRKVPGHNIDGVKTVFHEETGEIEFNGAKSKNGVSL